MRRLLLLSLVCAIAVAVPVLAGTPSCANGEIDRCCHLEQYIDGVRAGYIQLLNFDATHAPSPPCSPSEQLNVYDGAGADLCRYDCWGSAISHNGLYMNAPTKEAAINATIQNGCVVNFVVGANNTCVVAPEGTSTGTSNGAQSATGSTGSTTDDTGNTAVPSAGLSVSFLVVAAAVAAIAIAL